MLACAQVWVNLADRVGVEALKRTTRDEPNYDTLMKYRLDIMKKEGLTIHDVNAAIEQMDPLPGAVDMVAWLRERFQVIILSDTFYEFGMARRADPRLRGHRCRLACVNPRLTLFRGSTGCPHTILLQAFPGFPQCTPSLHAFPVRLPLPCKLSLFAIPVRLPCKPSLHVMPPRSRS